MLLILISPPQLQQQCIHDNKGSILRNENRWHFSNKLLQFISLFHKLKK